MVDPKDEKILAELTRDAKQTSKQISNKTLIPITTVHNRIKKLEKVGIIRNYTIQLDDKTLGTVSAYVMATVGNQFLKEKARDGKEIINAIRSHPNVEYVSMLTGSFDIMLKVRVKSISDLDGFVTKHLRGVPGIERTQTMIILNEA